MDLSKISEVFDPNSIKERINIIGCGSVGSTIAELLARYGLTNFVLWDMDKVEEKNIVNQMFFAEDIYKYKTESVKRIICNINPEAESKIVIKNGGWNGQLVKGYVFLAVDDIEIRKQFMNTNYYNFDIRGVFDIRTGLYDAQCWSANWNSMVEKDNLKESMNFTREEANAATPVSACGIVQGVAPTIRMISCLAVTNFINFATKGELKKMILANPFDLNQDIVIAV